MKIFLSWSGQLSFEFASIFRNWLNSVIRSLEPCLSSEDIRKGSRWLTDILRELNDTSIGIIFIVPGNHNSPWLNFEAGAISKAVDSACVIPLLIGVERSELEGGPLSQFQSALFSKEEVYKILESINEKLEKGKLTDKKMNEIYQVWWPELEKSVKPIIKSIRERGLKEEGPNGKPSNKTELDELEIKILLALSELKGTDTTGAAVVANLFQVSEAKAKYYLDELVRKKYALDYLTIGRPRRYSLAHKGREYLVKNNWVFSQSSG